MRHLARAVALAASLMTALADAPVRAAPGEHGALQDSSARFAEAQRRLDAGDHDGAVALLEQGLDRVPDGPGYAPTRARMLLLIVAAHEIGFGIDGDLERLRRARRLLDRYLGPLDLLDEQGRGEAEERRSGLIGQIARIEAARRLADSERAAAEQRARAERARKQARSLTIAGAVTTSLGLAGLTVMAAGLAVGSSADARIDALVASYGDTACQPESAECEGRYVDLQAERRRGNAGNIMFITGAATGGALLITGVTLLALARKKTREARALQLSPAPMISQTGLGLALVGRF